MENPLLLFIINNVKDSFSFIGEGKDKDGRKYKFENYSITIQIFPSWEDKIKIIFPNFSITHLYSNYYTIGFNKTLKQ